MSITDNIHGGNRLVMAIGCPQRHIIKEISYDKEKIFTYCDDHFPLDCYSIIQIAERLYCEKCRKAL